MKSWWIILVVLESISLIEALCPDTTVPSLNNASICYQFVTKSEVFTEAEVVCQSNGGHLASITDGFTNTFLAQNANKTFTQADFWIGGDDFTGKNQWTWIDGAIFGFSNWAPDEPVLLPGYFCISVTISNSFWYTSTCYDEKPFVCELPALIVPSTSAPTQGTTTPGKTTLPDLTTAPPPEATTTGIPVYSCEDDTWNYFETTHDCFKVFPNQNFSNMETTCEQNFGYLASIHNANELKFLDGLLDNYYYWIGLCTSDNGVNWYYQDGTPADYFPWCAAGAQKEPNTCVVISPALACFTNIHTTLATQGICKKPAKIDYERL